MDAVAELTRALAGRYRIERELGRGGMAVVYLARDVKHGRDVAIKVLRLELTGSGFSLERFSREVRFSATLQHPHILPLYDSGEAAGRVFCVMPFVPGETLRARMTREKSLPIDEALRLTHEIASALAHAHEKGVVHRDIKPENVLLSDGKAIVADFGIARAIGPDAAERLTQTGYALGTPHYMSPEQGAGQTDVDGRSDIYSLACVTYEMLTGDPPFVGNSAQAIIARHLQQDAPSARIVRKTVPEHVDEAVRRALAKEPSDRFATATEFGMAITGETTLAMRVRGRRRSWARYAAVAAGAIALAALARLGWSRWGSASSLDADLVAVAPFDVPDAKLAAWREGLLDLLARNLNGAGPLRAVPASVAMTEWKGRADEASAVRLARRTAARTGIVGSVYAAGSDSVRLTASLFDARGRRLIADVGATVPVARMDRAADSLTVRILGAIGRERPLGEARPPSNGPNAIAALKAYLTGEHYYRETIWDSAQRHYERAVQLDSLYALAYHRLSYVRTRRSSGIDSLIWFNGIRAGQLARGLPDRDSLAVTVDSLQGALWYFTNRQTMKGRDSAMSVLRPRLFSTLEIATRRFPEDSEIWFALAENLVNFGGHTRPRTTLDALNRSIRLDSANLPAYARAIRMSAVLDGPDSLRRYVAAYLARNPAGTGADAARLIDVLMDRRRANSSEAAASLSGASPRVLLDAWLALYWWYDSAQTSLRVVTTLRAHPEAVRLDIRGAEYLRLLTAMSLSFRGRIREACEEYAGHEPHRYIFPQLAYLGCVSRDSAASLFSRMMQDDKWQPSLVALYVANWGAAGDTARLSELHRRGDAAARASPHTPAAAYGQLLSESAQAYLALLRRDSAAAVRHFLNAPDSLCRVCDAQRLDKARVLVAAGQDRRAFELLDYVADDNQFPLGFLMRLERARISERLGDRARAIDDYRRVMDAWSVGDPAMRDTAKVARDALARLGVR